MPLNLNDAQSFKALVTVIVALCCAPLALLSALRIILWPIKALRRNKRQPARRSSATVSEPEPEAQAAPPAATPAIPKRRPGRPRKNPQPAVASTAEPKRRPGRPRKAAPQTSGPAARQSVKAPAQHSAQTQTQHSAQNRPLPSAPVTLDVIGNNMLRGHVVALPSISDAALESAIISNGGRVFNGEYAPTLVIINGASAVELDALKALSPSARLIGLSDLRFMLDAPLTFDDLNQLAHYVRAKLHDA